MKKPTATVDLDLLAAYGEMSKDEIRESDALEWIEELIEDGLPQPGERRGLARPSA